MPQVKFLDEIIECNTGDNLRSVLLAKGLYHPLASWIHCRGLGSCGTCAVQVKPFTATHDHPESTVEEGSQEQTAELLSSPTWIERVRLNFPPHKESNSRRLNLRLACQCQVLKDCEIVKHDGLWGHRESQGDS